MTTAFQTFFRGTLRAAAAMVLAAPLQAQPTTPAKPTSAPTGQTAVLQESLPTPVNLRQIYPAKSIASTETADNALKDVKKERAAIEARLTHEEKWCYKNEFLANKCRDQARTRRRLALNLVREVEVEANQYKRHAAVTKREQGLTEKRAREQEDAPARATSAQEHARKMNEKQRELQQKQQTVNSKHGENEAAYAEKVRKAEERQRKVAAKKAEKEEKRQKQAAAQNNKDKPTPAEPVEPTRR